MAGKIETRQDSDGLVFYEGAGISRVTSSHPLLRISPTELKIGTTTSDVDLKIFLGSGTEYVLFDAGNSRVDFSAPIVNSATLGYRSTATFVPDSTYTNYAFSVGNKVTELTVNFDNASDQNFNPIQAVVDCTATSTGPTNSSQMNLFYSKITHDTNAMANLRLKCADFTVVSNKDCRDIYAYQGEIILSGTMTVGGEAAVLGLVMDAGSGTVTGSALGIHMALRGSALAGMTANGFYMSVGSGATITNGIYIETQSGTAIGTSIRLGCASGTTITTGLHIGGAGTFTKAMAFGGTITYFADFDLCSGANGTITSDGGSEPSTWKARIKVKTDDGTDCWIKLFSTSGE